MQASPAYARLLQEQLMCCPSFQHPDAAALIDQLDCVSEQLGEAASKEASAKRWLATARLHSVNKDWDGMEAAYLRVLPLLPSALGASKTNEVLVSLASTYVRKGSTAEALGAMQRALAGMTSISELDALSHVKRMAALLPDMRIEVGHCGAAESSVLIALAAVLCSSNQSRLAGEDDLWDVWVQKREVIRQLAAQRHRLISVTAAPNVQKSQPAQVQVRQPEVHAKKEKRKMACRERNREMGSADYTHVQVMHLDTQAGK
eukprot:34764-Pelagomonas_calceolata.AAC.2